MYSKLNRALSLYGYKEQLELELPQEDVSHVVINIREQI